MSFAPRSARTTACVVVLLVVLASFLPLTAGAPARAAGAPLANPLAAPPTGSVAPVAAPPVLCCNVSPQFTVLIGNNSTAWNATPVLPTFGPAPVTVNFTIQVWDSLNTSWRFLLAFGDGNSSVGWVNTSASGWGNTTVGHLYTVPAIYGISANLSTSGPNPATMSVTYGQALQVYGAGGPDPVTVSVSVGAGYVPLTVTYTANISALPANTTLLWTFVSPDTTTTELFGGLNHTITWTYPGDALAWLTVFYGSSTNISGLGPEYGVGNAPAVVVEPTVLISIATTDPPLGTSGPITFWANLSSLVPGGVPTGTVEWDFTLSGGPQIDTVSGPTTGSPVTENFTVVAFAGQFVEPFQVQYAASSGVVLAANFSTIYLNSSGGPPGPVIVVTTTPSSGIAPLTVAVQVLTGWYYSTGNSTAGSNYSVNLCVGSATNLTQPCSIFDDTFSPWYGGLDTITFDLLAPGLYAATATLTQYLWNTTGTLSLGLGSSTALVNVSASGSIGSSGPLTISASGTTANGSVPLSAAVQVLAGGGTAPYNLSICVVGPSHTPNATGTCTPLSTLTNWNGSAVTVPVTMNRTGYYTAVVTVADSGSPSAVVSTNVTFLVVPMPRGPPLAVQASGVPSPGDASTYDFLATITGGVGPYTIQWSFGDGTYGTSLPGGTATHQYLASGSYTVTITVTDATGATVTSTVGPLLVTLPVGSSSHSAPLSSDLLLVGELVVAALAVAGIGLAIRTANERRRARAWLDAVESEPFTPSGPK